MRGLTASQDLRELTEARPRPPPPGISVLRKSGVVSRSSQRCKDPRDEIGSGAIWVIRVTCLDSSFEKVTQTWHLRCIILLWVLTLRYPLGHDLLVHSHTHASFVNLSLSGLRSPARSDADPSPTMRSVERRLGLRARIRERPPV